MPDLSVHLSGKHPLTLKNPIIPASGTFGYGLEFAPYGNLEKLGGLVVKGLSLKPRAGNAMPRVAETASGMLNAVGLQNDGVEVFVKDKLPKLPWKKTAIIANIYASSAEEFATLTDILSAEEGIAALEINISCPNVHEGGILFGQDATMAAKLTEAVCKAARNKPIIVKLSPNVTNIAHIAKAVESAGADMISCINTLSGMGVDICSRKPLLSNVIGGLSGPAIKPVALRCVWQVAQSVKIPVIGLGGISSATDVLEFLLVGAHAVQIGTANFMRPDFSFELVDKLEELCQEYSIDNLNDFRGSLLLE